MVPGADLVDEVVVQGDSGSDDIGTGPTDAHIESLTFVEVTALVSCP